jgi:hypothetical protein
MLQCNIITVSYSSQFAVIQVFNRTRNIKYYEVDVDEYVKCLYRDAQNAIQCTNGSQELKIYVVGEWKIRSREEGRRLPVMLATPKYYILKFLVENSSVLFLR